MPTKTSLIKGMDVLHLKVNIKSKLIEPIVWEGNIKKDKTNNLGVRKWICDNCSNENDRDINASINIMFEGLKYYFS